MSGPGLEKGVGHLTGWGEPVGGPTLSGQCVGDVPDQLLSLRASAVCTDVLSDTDLASHPVEEVQVVDRLHLLDDRPVGGEDAPLVGAVALVGLDEPCLLQLLLGEVRGVELGRVQAVPVPDDDACLPCLTNTGDEVAVCHCGSFLVAVHEIDITEQGWQFPRPSPTASPVSSYSLLALVSTRLR